MNLIVPPWPDRLSTRVDRTFALGFRVVRHGRDWQSVAVAQPRLRVRAYTLAGDRTVYSDADTQGEIDGDAGKVGWESSAPRDFVDNEGVMIPDLED